MDVLKLLYDYFPTAVYTGKCLVFISEENRIELTEHKNSNFSQPEEGIGIVRVRIFTKALNGEFVPGHYEDFELPTIGEMAMQIERYVQFAVGKDIRENV